MADLDKIRDAVLELLSPYGVKRIALFGSVARGEDTPDSDIDILVKLESPHPRPLGFITWAGIELELAERLGQKVDLVSEAALSRHIRPYVEEEIVLYGKAG